MKLAPALIIGAALAAAAGLAAAQTNPLPQLASIVTFAASQQVPVTVQVVVPIDGELITMTLPVSATISTEVTLLPINNAEPTPTVEPPEITVDTAALLLPTLSELPTGYYQSETGSLLTNAEVAQSFTNPDEIAAQLDQLGRLGGASGMYPNGQYSIIKGGNGRIWINVLAFKTAEGALNYVDTVLEREATDKSATNGAFQVAAPPIGPASIVTISTETADGRTASTYQLFFAYSNAVVIISSIGMEGQGDVDELLTIANRILARGVNQPSETPER